MTGKIIKIGVAMVIVAAAVSTVAVRAADISKLQLLKHQRMAREYQKTQQYKNETNRAFVNAHVIDGGTKNAIPSEHSRTFGQLLPERYNFASSGAMAPAPSLVNEGEPMIG